ncbi:MAG: Uma2 family endonuclease [Vulcanimicrobiaceae bacterium]
MAIALAGLPRLSDDDLERISRLNPGWAFERDDDGVLLVSPTHTTGGPRNVAALAQLLAWSQRGAGGKVFDSSTGFTLPSGAVRSPDASWVSAERIAALSDRERRGFWPLCPDVVVEIASESDAWSELVAKIEMYARNGARYALAIDPQRRTTFAAGEPPAGLDFDIAAIVDA